jgi:digeranylgeranylglycerophospholipid reductase
LGISGVYSGGKKPLEYLREFIDKKFSGASIQTMVAGGVPVMPTLKQIVRDGFMLVGDAAHQANPISGGGIANAMIAGRIAGRVAAEAVRAGDVSERKLSAYPKEWRKAEGKINERFYRIKKAVDRFTDEDLNRTARMLLSVPTEERTVLQVFKKALYKNPKLIFEAIKAFR